MTREEYAKHLATVSDRVLVDIIDKPDETHPDAVAAAQVELATRQVPPENIADIRAERSRRDLSADAYQRGLNSVVKGAGDMATELRRSIIERGDEAAPDKRQHRLMLVAIGLIFLTVSPRFGDLPWLLDGAYDFSTLEYFAPLLLLPLVLYLLWRRERWGWFLGAGITVYTFVSSLISAYLNWGNQPTGMFALDQLFPTPSYSQILFDLLFAVSVAGLFQMQRSLALFRISGRERWLTVASVLVIGIWMWSSLL